MPRFAESTSPAATASVKPMLSRRLTLRNSRAPSTPRRRLRGARSLVRRRSWKPFPQTPERKRVPTSQYRCARRKCLRRSQPQHPRRWRRSSHPSRTVPTSTRADSLGGSWIHWRRIRVPFLLRRLRRPPPLRSPKRGRSTGRLRWGWRRRFSPVWCARSCVATRTTTRSSITDGQQQGRARFNRVRPFSLQIF